MVSHAFKKAFTEEDHKLSTDASNAGAYACWKCTFCWSCCKQLKENVLHFDVFSVQRVFRLAGTVSKKSEETLSQEILVGFC